MTDTTAPLDLRGTTKTTNHWEGFGTVLPEPFTCTKEREFCSTCGRQMVESLELVGYGMRSRTTGLLEHARYHSCPTWVTGWRTSRWARGWACPGMHHDSHDADNPLSSRGYR